MTVIATTIRGRRARRLAGLSLLELLVVMGLLLALLAIAVPFTLRSIEERELSATEENFASELLKARVQAQESGRPVEVVVLDEPSRIVLRYFDPKAWEDLASESSRRPRGETSARPGTSDRRGGRGVRDTWWEESPIASSVRVASAPTFDSTDAAAETGLPSAPEAEEDASPRGGPMRVAVFMPDGSILFAASLILMHENGLRSRVSVDPWTGQPAIARSAAAASSASSTSDDEITLDEYGEPSDEDGATPSEPDARLVSEPAKGQDTQR